MSKYFCCCFDGKNKKKRKAKSQRNKIMTLASISSPMNKQSSATNSQLNNEDSNQDFKAGVFANKSTGTSTAGEPDLVDSYLQSTTKTPRPASADKTKAVKRQSFLSSMFSSPLKKEDGKRDTLPGVSEQLELPSFANEAAPATRVREPEPPTPPPVVYEPEPEVVAVRNEEPAADVPSSVPEPQSQGDERPVTSTEHEVVAVEAERPVTPVEVEVAPDWSPRNAPVKSPRNSVVYSQTSPEPIAVPIKLEPVDDSSSATTNASKRKSYVYNGQVLNYIPYDILIRVCPPGADPDKKEALLSDEDFAKYFKMNKAKFESQPKWRRDQLKKQLSLF
jgi:hypothetical protein